jgi:hypothetical protein
MSLLARFNDYRDARAAAKQIRKLQQLRRRLSPAGYTLSSFDEHRCIFVHIPKCAGVSICQSLFGNYGAGHHSIATFRQVFDAQSFDHYFKFAFVRNPWDRLLSAWQFLRAGGFNDTDRRWARRHLDEFPDFATFVRRWLTPDNARSWVHFIPQTDFIRLPDGRPGVDFIGRYERLEADFRYVCSKLSITAPLSTRNATAPPRHDYRTAYDNDTRSIVARVYARDIAELGYDFDNGIRFDAWAADRNSPTARNSG